MNLRFVLIAHALLLSLLQHSSSAQARENDLLIPQNLLGLVHAPEVHAELRLSDEQQQQLETLFMEIDGDWLRARVLMPEKQITAKAALEKRVLEWFQKQGTAEQQTRLKQLELQSLGTRLLLRPEVMRDLQLDSSQQSQLVGLAKAADLANLQLQQATFKSENTSALKTTAADAMAAEQKSPQTLLTPTQQKKLSQLIGKPFDTAQLKRIYPMAPEFVPTEDWINSPPLTLKQLRGKVVILHYYAFQCHNCHANFEHYSGWHKRFSNDEVVVIGIQRPETSAEHDAAAVRAAAKQRKMEYPILIDLESKNWDAWANTMWPTVYIIDQQGYLRHWWQGELNWQGATEDKTITDLVNSLIKE